MQTQYNDPLNTPLTKTEKKMNDAIGLYLNDIGKVALLTAEDERTLSKAIEKGREAAALYEAGEKTAAVRKYMKAAAVAKTTSFAPTCDSLFLLLAVTHCHRAWTFSTLFKKATSDSSTL